MTSNGKQCEIHECSVSDFKKELDLDDEDITSIQEVVKNELTSIYEAKIAQIAEKFSEKCSEINNSMVKLTTSRDDFESYKDHVLNELENKKALFAKLHNISGSKCIKLNVGGTLFQTTTRTLIDLGPWFEAILSDKFKPSLDADGNIFIDRDPTYFGVILNLGRTNFNTELIDHIMKTKVDRIKFMVELDYFNIDIKSIRVCNQLQKGNNIKIYWRGGRGKIYIGTIKDINRSENTITVKYDDGECWKYVTHVLNRETGRHKDEVLSTRYDSIKWIHYHEALQLEGKTNTNDDDDD